MKNSEISRLLAVIAATDNRTVGKLDIETWAEILPDDMPLADAQSAVIHHRQTSTEWLTPKHIIDAVGSVRRERLTRAGTPPIPGELDQAQERAWSKLWCAAVKDGDPNPAATANHAMNIRPQLTVADPLSAELRKELIRKLAESKGIPKDVKPKRKHVEYVDDTGQSDADGVVAAVLLQAHNADAPGDVA